MEQFWQQDRLILSLELFGVFAAAFTVVALGILINRNTQGTLHFKMPKDTLAILIFKVARMLLSLIGIATLVVTILPGLMPFKDRIDPNLELGGIALFLLWPLILIQVIIGFLPIETKLAPPLAWGLLIIGFFICLNICKATIGLVYN